MGTEIDLKAYGNEDFHVDQFLNKILVKLPEDGVRSYRATLKDAKDAAAKDLQRNVHRNYSEFVVISKEISSLEGDVLQLRGLLNELAAVNTGYKMGQAVLSDDNVAHEDVPDSSQGGTLAPKKPSMANSTELQDQQHLAMETLYETIDGLKKALPVSKSRHLLRNGTDTPLSEINPTNYKHKQHVMMHVLSDTLVVVMRKKNILNGKSKVVVEKCLRLVEMAVIDMKDSSDITNAFKIMSHPDVYMFRTETWEEKRSLLALIKRVTDEIIGQKKKDKEVVSKAMPKPAVSVDAATPTLVVDTAAIKEDSMGPRKEELPGVEAKWLAELSYDLDVLIAHREFDTAVTEILKARNLFTTYPNAKITHPHLRQDVQDRADVLASVLCRDLANPIASKTQIQANIDWLILLGLGSLARRLFLESRTVIIRHRIKLVKFDGDVIDYVTDLSMVIFRLIRRTCDWYNASFKESTMASGFLKWVRREIEHFGDIIRRQVFDSQKQFGVIAECLDRTVQHCEMLRDIGLDLTFVLTQLFHNDVVAAIEEYRTRGKAAINQFIDQDEFHLVECTQHNLTTDGEVVAGIENAASVSVSVLQLYDFLMEFGADMGLIMSISLYAKIVWSLTDFFSTYLIRVMDVFEKEWTNKQVLAFLFDIKQKITRLFQYYAIISSCGYVIDKMMPQVAAQLAQRFDRSIPELEEHRRRLRGVVTTMESKFVAIKVKYILQEVFGLQAVDYSSTASILENAKPTENVILFLSELNSLLKDAENSSTFRKILVQIIHGVIHSMNEASSWETDRGPLRFGFCGVQQLVLDIHFFLHVAEPFVTAQVNDMANKICEKALRTYFTQNAKIRTALKGGEWYDKRVQEETRNWNFPFLTMNELAGANQF
ncbi:exocyst complex component exo84 [Podochytrium sp. JEL0797]|nr:exocyst complex component exo84 [Podochytrium sp. JEL0797]